MSRKKNKFKIQVVEWWDAIHSEAIYKFRDGSSVSKMLTVGFVVSEDDRQVLLAGQLDFEGGTTRDQTAIPKGCIHRRHTFGEVEPKEVKRK